MRRYGETINVVSESAMKSLKDLSLTIVVDNMTLYCYLTFMNTILDSDDARITEGCNNFVRRYFIPTYPNFDVGGLKKEEIEKTCRVYASKRLDRIVEDFVKMSWGSDSLFKLISDCGLPICDKSFKLLFDWTDGKEERVAFLISVCDETGWNQVRRRTIRYCRDRLKLFPECVGYFGNSKLSLHEASPSPVNHYFFYDMCALHENRTYVLYRLDGQSLVSTQRAGGGNDNFFFKYVRGVSTNSRGIYCLFIDKENSMYVMRFNPANNYVSWIQHVADDTVSGDISTGLDTLHVIYRYLCPNGRCMENYVKFKLPRLFDTPPHAGVRRVLVGEYHQPWVVIHGQDDVFSKCVFSGVKYPTKSLFRVMFRRTGLEISEHKVSYRFNLEIYEYRNREFHPRTVISQRERSFCSGIKWEMAGNIADVYASYNKIYVTTHDGLIITYATNGRCEFEYNEYYNVLTDVYGIVESDPIAGPYVATKYRDTIQMFDCRSLVPSNSCKLLAEDRIIAIINGRN